MSDDGTVVVGVMGPPGIPLRRAFIWTEDTGTMLLEQRLGHDHLVVVLTAMNSFQQAADRDRGRARGDLLVDPHDDLVSDQLGLDSNHARLAVIARLDGLIGVHQQVHEDLLQLHRIGIDPALSDAEAAALSLADGAQVVNGYDALERELRDIEEAHPELIAAVSASLANALLIRVMDYNDIYWQQDPAHPSDIIPAALATVD